MQFALTVISTAVIPLMVDDIRGLQAGGFIAQELLGNPFIQSLLSSSLGANDWLGIGMGDMSQESGIFTAGSER
ncbi:MAG: hypothetical protein AAFV53_43240, partial [Myxococcota bacterium]